MVIGARLLLLSIIPVALIFACGGDGDEIDEPPGESIPATDAEEGLSSDSLGADGTIPSRFTCDGEDVSPALSWGEAPEGTRSLALTMDDPDATGGNFSHWLIYNMDPGARSLPEDVEKTERPANGEGGVQAENDFGDIGYGGPCPPAGEAHRYHFRLYAIDVRLLVGDATAEDLLTAIGSHILAVTTLTSTYERAQ